MTSQNIFNQSIESIEKIKDEKWRQFKWEMNNDSDAHDKEDTEESEQHEGIPKTHEFSHRFKNAWPEVIVEIEELRVEPWDCYWSNRLFKFISDILNILILNFNF